LQFSFIIPVYNRPSEVQELLESLSRLDYDKPFEVVIIEDGSTEKSDTIVSNFQNQLMISYYFKPNSGPGDSRNFGMKRAKGTYFLILDSDVLLPSDYLKQVEAALTKYYVPCFGGIDAAHPSFTPLQKAINFVMTSFLTTGGVRGTTTSIGSKLQSETKKQFQPRSFNMGLSKEAFELSGGFGSIHPGEDPDLSLRLIAMGLETDLFNNVKVYHKRRISWSKFWYQVVKFGKCRPILFLWHRDLLEQKAMSSLKFWFPSLFLLGTIFSVMCAIFGVWYFLYLLLAYVLLVFFAAWYSQQSIGIATRAVVALFVQFLGYGYGFLISYVQIFIFGKEPKEAFPELFFTTKL